MSFTGPGWYLLSTTTDQTISQAMASWGISTSTVYKYMYELKNAPILASPTVQLTADNWMGTDISANPTFLLNPMKAYWVNIQTLILDIVLRGTGELNSSTVTSMLPSTVMSNVIIRDYTTIGTSAFAGASSLTTITIPASIITIDNAAFTGCSGLTSVIFENQTNFESLSAIHKFTIGSNQSFCGASPVTLIAGYPTGLTSTTLTLVDGPPTNIAATSGTLIIPSGIPLNAIVTVSLGTDVTNIGNQTFYNAANLKTVTFDPSSQLISIGDYAFTMTAITSIELPSSVTSIGVWAFMDAFQLTSISIPNKVTSIGYGTFMNASKLKSITIPRYVTSIGQYAFLNATSLISITIPPYIISIDNTAFEGCSGLTSVILESPASLESLKVRIGSNTTFFGSGPVTIIAGYYTSTLLTLQDVTTQIITQPPPIAANSGIFTVPSDIPLNNIISVNIGADVTSIAKNTFFYAENLKSVTISSSVTSIEDDAFAGTKKLKYVAIPKEVTKIGQSAFQSSGIPLLIVPINVKSIGISAFAGDNFAVIILPRINSENIGRDIFYNSGVVIYIYDVPTNTYKTATCKNVGVSPTINSEFVIKETDNYTYKDIMRFHPIPNLQEENFMYAGYPVN